MKRLVTAIIAIAMLGLTPLALTTAASADSIAPAPGASAPATNGAETQAKKKRKVTARGKTKSNGLFLTGRVSPNYPNSEVLIKRSSKAKSGYRVFNRVKTNGKGYFSSKVAAPAVGKKYYYFAQVKPRGKYTGDKSQVLVATRG